MITYPCRNRAHRTHDNGSIPLAMLLVLVGISLSTILATIVIAQIGTTRDTMQRVRSLDAAQAGIDVAVGHIQAAANGTDADGNPLGDHSDLPCALPEGRVGVAGAARYQVRIDYLDVDPRGRDDAWIAANAVPCNGGSGPEAAPKYAVLRAEGTDRTTGSITAGTHRALRATYTIRIAERNIAGGLVHLYKDAGGQELCLDAGSDDPADGQLLKVQPCTPDSAAQEFAYTKDLNLVLVSTWNTNPPGMCLDATAPTDVTPSRQVEFQPCIVGGLPLARARQIWSFNDSSNFQGTADGLTLSSPAYCFNVQPPSKADNYVLVERQCSGGYNSVRTFSVEAAVGAGAAGESTAQLVNYKQFGRCLDVTDQAVSRAYMIVWPCKQSPNGVVTWNQKWTLPLPSTETVTLPGRLFTSPAGAGGATPGSDYCLRSPRSTAFQAYATLEACPVTLTPELTWTRYEKHKKIGFSYTIRDVDGRCLTPVSQKAATPDFYTQGEKISKAIVAKCDGTTLQKWNAPPTSEGVPLKDIDEN